jgi:hypothetical protein
LNKTLIEIETKDKFVKKIKETIRYIFGVVMLIILFFSLFLLIKFDQTRLERRNHVLKELNSYTKAEIIEIKGIAGGSQGLDGASTYFTGITINYKYYVKGVLFKNEDFIPNEKDFRNIIKRCLKLKKYDEIEIKLDSLNPANSLIHFK